MFCAKCGMKLGDQTKFCTNCGTPVAEEMPVAANTSVPEPQTAEVQQSVRKKKRSAIPVVIGVLALLVVAVGVAVMLLTGSSVDFVETVRAWEPFDDSQNIPGTCGEVFDRYIEDAEWTADSKEMPCDVTVTGAAAGMDYEISVTIRVSEHKDDPDLVTFDVRSVAVDQAKAPDKEQALEFLLAMFRMNDENVEDFSEMLSEDGVESWDELMYGAVDLEKTVRAWEPFAQSQGYYGTCGEIFDLYIEDQKWTTDGIGYPVDVTVTGTAAGRDYEISFTIRVSADEEDPDEVRFEPVSVSVDKAHSPDEEFAVEFLLALFMLRDEGYDDFTVIFPEDEMNSWDEIRGLGVEAVEAVPSASAGVLSSTDAIELLTDWLDEHGVQWYEVGSLNSVQAFGNTYYGFYVMSYEAGDFTVLVAEDGSELLYDSEMETMTLDEWYEWMYSGNSGTYDTGFYYEWWLPVESVLWEDPQVLYEYLGDPEYGTPVDGDMFEGGAYYGYANGSFFINYDTGLIQSLSCRASEMLYNSCSLEQDRDGLVDILGTPVYEALEYDAEYDEYKYIMEFYVNGLDVIVYMKDENSVAYSVLISYLAVS